MSLGVSPKVKPLKLAFWDIIRAHLHDDAWRDLYVDLPPEDYASQIWQKDYAKSLGGKNWRQGASNGALFWDTVSQPEQWCTVMTSCCLATTTT
eukprot:3059445-Amphidinium_carterae.3